MHRGDSKLYRILKDGAWAILDARTGTVLDALYKGSLFQKTKTSKNLAFSMGFVRR